MSAATSSSSSRPSTSRGYQNDQHDLFSFLLDPESLQLIQKNRLKLVPIEQEDTCIICDDARERLNRVEAENESLRALVAEHERELEESRRRIAELEGGEELRGELDSCNRRREELEIRLASQSDTFTELQLDAQRELDEARIRREEAEKQSKLSEAMLNEKEEASRRMNSQMEENFKKNNARIIALCNEKEMVVQEKFKLIAFARQIKELSHFEDPIHDLLESNQLGRMLAHVRPLFEERDGVNAELARNRQLMKQLGDIFYNTQSDAAARAQQQVSTAYYRSTSPAGLPPTATAANTPPATPSKPAQTTSSSAAAVVSPTPMSEEPNVLSRDSSPRSPLAAQVATPTSAWNANSTPQNASTSSSPQPSVSVSPAPCSSTHPISILRLEEQHLHEQNQDAESHSIQAPPPGTCTQRTDAKTLTKSKRKNTRYNPKGQLTEYVATSKRHGVNKACSQFKCFCGNSYSNDKSLGVHIRKMTTAWKYRCHNCHHYFFYKSDHASHLARSTRCRGGRVEEEIPGGVVVGFGDELIDELIGIRQEPAAVVQPPRQQPSITVAISSNMITTSSSSSNGEQVGGKMRDNNNMRKLQQSILRRKRHAPWLSKKGLVQGVWYCVCGSKFKSKSNLATHVQYFTHDWKFKCELCPNENFMYLCYLKKHMVSTHKIKEPMGAYKMGCQLCGSLFVRISDYWIHRKTVHNLHRKSGMGSPRKSRSNTSSSPSSSQRPAGASPLTQPPTSTLSSASREGGERSEQGPQAGPSTTASSSALEQLSASSASSSSSSSITFTPTRAECMDMEVIDVSSDEDDDQDVRIISPAAVGQIKDEFRISSVSPSSRHNNSSNNGSETRHEELEPDPLFIDPDNPDAKQFACECGRSYSSRKELLLHIKVAKFEKVHLCLDCSLGFRLYVELEDHITQSHKKELHAFKCGFCSMCFTSRRTFSAHYAREHDQ